MHKGKNIIAAFYLEMMLATFSPLKGCQGRSLNKANGLGYSRMVKIKVQGCSSCLPGSSAMNESIQGCQLSSLRISEVVDMEEGKEDLIDEEPDQLDKLRLLLFGKCQDKFKGRLANSKHMVWEVSL